MTKDDIDKLTEEEAKHKLLVIYGNLASVNVF